MDKWLNMHTFRGAVVTVLIIASGWGFFFLVLYFFKGI